MKKGGAAVEDGAGLTGGREGGGEDSGDGEGGVELPEENEPRCLARSVS
mgnify:CR=1 FL=1